ncbi:nucleotidyltransferase domain-containing protein [Clostridium butyricum]|uniref:nucleotidyltransferase domain-containing protein n=1 Tax=Clostridium butyricum TaxID=1492 RepID=UPI00374F341C
MYGLLERDIRYIKKALEQCEEIEKAIIFGSRAMGNYKNGSDVDIAVLGELISNNTILKLNDYLNEIYPLPYFFDIINYNSITNENLKKHIDVEGKIIYTK